MYWVSLQAVSNGSEKSEISKPFDSESINSEGLNEASNLMPVSDKAISRLKDSTSALSLDAHTIAPSQNLVPPKMPNTGDQLIEVALALALVVGLIYAAAWLVKRNKTLSPSAGIPMKTLSVLPMGVKEKIILVEVGGKQLLLGMTPHQINTLATFDEPIVDTSLNNEKPFATRLKEMLNQGKGIETNNMEPKE